MKSGHRVHLYAPQLHPENTIAAAEAGKHIVIEKAIANTPKDMRAMADAVDKAGVKTVVSFVLRWNPLFTTIKSLIADDAIGDVYYTEADYQHDIASWWTGYEEGRTKALGVSAMLVAGCHALDACRWFASKDPDAAAVPVEVFAYAGGYRKGLEVEYDYFANTWKKAPPLEYDDLEVVLIKFSNGALGRCAPITVVSCRMRSRWKCSANAAPSRTTASGRTNSRGRTTGSPFPVSSP